MNRFLEILEMEGSRCEAEAAYSFRKDRCWTVLNAENEDEEVRAGALVVFDTSMPSRYEIVETFEFSIAAYKAFTENFHVVVDITGNVILRDNGERRVFPFTKGEFVHGLFQYPKGEIIAFGSDGSIFAMSEQKKRLGSTDERDLRAGIATKNGRAIFGGDDGALFELQDGSLNLIDIRGEPSIKSLGEETNGGLLIGCEDGIAFRLDGDELESLEGEFGTAFCIAQHEGLNLLGDDSYGVLEIQGSRILPKYPTGLAYNIASQCGFLNIEAGCWIYVAHEGSWSEFQINPNKNALFEQIPLDFTL
ncbi:hypothetical protein N9L47_12490 [Rhodobacteraceae bacterium]|nr:hypothetical protein [Paracoccaceae bacterium]